MSISNSEHVPDMLCNILVQHGAIGSYRETKSKYQRAFGTDIELKD